MLAGLRTWALVLGVVAVVPQFALAQLDDGSINFAADAAPNKSVKSVSKDSNKKIQMVTATLQDILQSVVNEEKQETILYTKYMTWCKTEQADVAGDLKESKTQLANAKVLSEEQVSSIDSLTLFIAKSSKEIEETKDAIAQAVALRTSENEAYTEEVQINTQSLRQIALAIKHVGKLQQQGGFLQNGLIKKLQVNQPGESGYVLGVMKGLQEKLTKTRDMMLKTEKEKVEMHNSFMTTKGSSLKALTDKRAEKKILLTETTAKEAGVNMKIGKLTDEVAKLTENLAKTVSTCQRTDSEWTVRQADRTKEKAALNEAIRFMTVDLMDQKLLIQKSDDEQNDASVVFAPSFLQEVSAAITENEFYKAAGAALMGEDDAGASDVEGHMKKDTFNGVTNVVKKLIGTHQDTGKEEETKKKYCENEIATKEEERDTTTDDLAAVKADIDKKSSEAETLADEVKTLYAAIKKNRESEVAAGKVRKEGAALYAASSKDRALAIKVLKQAMGVLQSFYAKKGNLLQQGRVDAPPPTKPTGPGSQKKSAASFGAVSMVQDIADDIAKEEKDAAMQEKDAAVAYVQLQKDTLQTNDDKQQDITDRVTAKAKLGVQINSLKETKEEKANDLDSENKQLKSLHDQCDELLKHFDARRKARTFEVSQLRDVMDILAGSGVAARTGLVQTDDEAVADAQADENSLDTDA